MEIKCFHVQVGVLIILIFMIAVILNLGLSYETSSKRSVTETLAANSKNSHMKEEIKKIRYLETSRWQGANLWKANLPLDSVSAIPSTIQKNASWLTVLETGPLRVCSNNNKEIDTFLRPSVWLLLFMMWIRHLLISSVLLPIFFNISQRHTGTQFYP